MDPSIAYTVTRAINRPPVATGKTDESWLAASTLEPERLVSRTGAGSIVDGDAGVEVGALPGWLAEPLEVPARAAPAPGAAADTC